MGARKIFKESKCVVCQDKPPDVIFESCNHQCVCKKCFDKLLRHAKKYIASCPICRTEISLPEHEFNGRSYYLGFRYIAFMLILVVMIARSASVYRLKNDVVVCTKAGLVDCFNTLVDLNRDAKLSTREIDMAQKRYFPYGYGIIISANSIITKCDKNKDSFIDGGEILECLDNDNIISIICHICACELKP